MCDKHMTKWCVGDNWFRCWREETEEVWRRNAERLSRYREISPVSPESRTTDTSHELLEDNSFRLGPSREELIAMGDCWM